MAGARITASKAVRFAAQTFNAHSPQNPDVHLGTITHNGNEPSFTGPYYAFEIVGLGPGPVPKNAQRERFLVLIDGRDGSRTLGFPLEQ